MPRSALPQDYNKIAGTLWENFEDVEDWTCDAGSIENNTSQYHTGSQSIKMNVEVAGGSARMHQLVSPSMDFSSINKCMELWIYPHDDAPRTNISDVTLYFYTDSDYYSIPINNSELYPEKWSRMLIPRSAWDESGSPDWSNITRIDVELNCAGGKTSSISVDSLYHGLEQEGRIVIGFDDARISLYTEAYSYMSAKGLKGTGWITPIWIGSDDDVYMNSDHLDELYEAGWVLANHTWSHPDLTSLSQSQIESQLDDCLSWLDARGYTRASRHLSYPGGSYNNTVFAAMDAVGILTGRTTRSGRLNLPADYKLIKQTPFQESTTLDYAKSRVDRSVDDGTTEVFYGHILGETAGSTSWVISDFQALIDYIVARRGNVVTIDEWYEGLINPRYTSFLPARANR